MNRFSCAMSSSGPEGLSRELVERCRRKLLEAKTELLNRVRFSKTEFYSLEKQGGDEVDQSVSLLAENQVLIQHDRLRSQLAEIEYALARISNGVFGVCEETHEFIEEDRLLAIPWTRLSIEGAEIREAAKKRFAP